MAETVAEIENIRVCYRDKTVLGPISLTIKKGEFWGVIGPNGAGKSTLLSIIAGFRKVSEGRLTVFGATYAPGSSGLTAQAKKQTGLLFQHHDFYPDLPFTVEDVVLFGRTGLLGFGRGFRRSDKEAARDAIASLNLENFRSRLYRELSGGEQRKVQLARLVAQEAELMLLDEPTAGLDIDWRERLTKLTEDLYNRSGKTIFMVTHDVDRLPACCTHVLLLQGGNVLAMGSPEDVIRSDTFSRLYNCTIEITHRNGRYHALSFA
jgi:ABC-type cobalamin/Fe3+-siderophores transport system ATPase subunit